MSKKSENYEKIVYKINSKYISCCFKTFYF